MGGKGSGGWNKQYDIQFTEPRPVGRPRRHMDDGIVRKRGRPIRGEEKDRPLIIHDLASMSGDYQIMCAKQTIEQANRIYNKYKDKYPNPLNMEDKLLVPEAKAVWGYIYGTRGYDGKPQSMKHDGTFRDAHEVCIAFEAFGNYIRERNFVKEFKRPDGEMGVLPIIPNQSNFARWLGVSRGVITWVMNVAEESDVNEYRSMLADLLSEGAMMGIYNTSMAIFSLKNLCDWADKYDDRPTKNNDTSQTVEEAQRLMASLGYTKQLGEPNEHQED